MSYTRVLICTEQNYDRCWWRLGSSSLNLESYAGRDAALFANI